MSLLLLAPSRPRCALAQVTLPVWRVLIHSMLFGLDMVPVPCEPLNNLEVEWRTEPG